MSSYAAHPSGLPAGHAPSSGSGTFVDPTRAGSALHQALVGIVGIVLAIVLVVGQVSVATTRGIQQNLHANIKHLKDGNRTMVQIIEKAAPSIAMQKVVAQQEGMLARTQQTMGLLNGEMKRIGTTTDDMVAAVGGMEQTASSLSSGVEGMNSDTAEIVRLLETLPAATTRTHTQLDRIAGDSAAINGELNQISGKMQRYGLPHAKNVRGRGGSR